MNFIKHPSNNFTYLAPPGTEDECGDLHVTRSIDPTFGHAITSFWLPSPEELAALNQGKPVAVTLFVPVQPVMSVGVVNE